MQIEVIQKQSDLLMVGIKIKAFPFTKLGASECPVQLYYRARLC
jgi:hypothetical protein